VDTSELRDLHILVPRSLYEALQAQARAEDRPLSGIVRNAVREALEPKRPA
jgi:hypothetical protein